MQFIYEKEIEIDEITKYELVGRAVLYFNKSYPKDDETLWWKIPEVMEKIISESYKRGYAEGAGIKKIDPKQVHSNN